jgi:hypothetical protein
MYIHVLSVRINQKGLNNLCLQGSIIRSMQTPLYAGKLIWPDIYYLMYTVVHSQVVG